MDEGKRGRSDEIKKMKIEKIARRKKNYIKIQPQKKKKKN